MDYILLMDDDINIEVSALERMHALLCGLKDDYISHFIGGAMLSMENRLFSMKIQHTGIKSFLKLMDMGET